MAKPSEGPKPKSIAIERNVHAQFAAACKGRAVGREIQDAATRLLKWFARQPQFVQTAVVTDVDLGMEQHYAAALEMLALELRAKAMKDERADRSEASKEKPTTTKPRRTLKVGHAGGEVEVPR